MYNKHSIAIVLAAATLVSISTASFAKHRMLIVDANSGKTLFDDGKLDGKGCAVGQRAVFDKETGTFRKVQAANCNF